MPQTRVRRRTVSRIQYKNRVMKVASTQQWNRLMKRGEKKLVFVMFWLEYGRNSHRLKSLLAELSGQDDFKHVEFAYVDIEKAQAVADEQKVTDAPTFIVYENCEVVERSERVSGDYASATMWQLLHKHAVRVKSEMARMEPRKEKRSLWGRMAGAVVTAIAVAASAVTFIFVKSRIESGSGSKGKNTGDSGKSHNYSKYQSASSSANAYETDSD